MLDRFILLDYSLHVFYGLKKVVIHMSYTRLFFNKISILLITLSCISCSHIEKVRVGQKPIKQTRMQVVLKPAGSLLMQQRIDWFLQQYGIILVSADKHPKYQVIISGLHAAEKSFDKVSLQISQHKLYKFVLDADISIINVKTKDEVTKWRFSNTDRYVNLNNTPPNTNSVMLNNSVNKMALSILSHLSGLNG